MYIAETIKALRIYKRLTVHEFARQAGLSASYISMLEDSKRQGTLAVLSQVADAFDLPLTLFIFLAEFDRLEKTNLLFVRSCLNANPELKKFILFTRLYRDGYTH